MSDVLEKSEHSYDESTNSTAGQRAWTVARVEKTVFQVALTVGKALERPYRKRKILGRLIVCIHILGFVITPQLWNYTAVGYFAQAILALQIPLWDAADFQVGHTESAIVMLVVACLLGLYFALWLWSVRAYSRESIRPWAITALAVCVRLFSSVLFIPILRLLVVHLACTNSFDGFVLTGYPKTNCFKDPFSLAVFSIAALFTALFVACVVATDVLIFNPSFNEKYMDNKATGRTDALSKLSTVAMVFAAHFLISRPIPLVAAFLVYAVVNLALYAVTLPYHMPFYNCLVIATWLTSLCVGFVALASVLTGGSIGAAVALYISLPVCFVVGYLLARLLYRRRARWVDRKLPDLLEDDADATDESFRGAGSSYLRRDRALKEHWPLVFMLEINMRFLLLDPTLENVARAERMLLYQCRYFPSAMAEIAYVQFVVSFKRDPILGRVRINRAKKLEPMLDERLLLLRQETIFEEERLSDAHGESISAAGLADMRKRLQDARRYHLETLKNFAEFWSELVHKDVLLSRLPAVMGYIEHSEERADFAFQKLMSKFPSSKVVLRAYAQYLEEVKMDLVAAQECSARADMLENVRRGAGAGRRSHEGSNAGHSDFTSSHSRGSGASSDILRRLASAGQAIELTQKVQNSSAMRRLRVTACMFFVGVFVCIIVGFSLFHADQARKTSRLALYEAGGNRASLLMRACAQARDLRVAATLNDTSLAASEVDAARAALSRTLVQLEYEHKRASIGLDGTVMSDYAPQAELVSERTITVIQLIERSPPMLRQRLVNIIDGGLMFLENAALLTKYSIRDLQTLDDDPAFRFVMDNGPGVLQATFSYSNDLLVEEEDATDSSLTYALVVMLIVFCLALNVPGFVMFQNVFDGIREERNFALNLFLLIPKGVIRHMLKEKKFQQNTRANVVTGPAASQDVDEPVKPAVENSSPKDSKGKEEDRPHSLPRRPGSPTSERPQDVAADRKLVQFRSKDQIAGPAPAGLLGIVEESDSSTGRESNDTHLYASDTQMERRPGSRSNSEPLVSSEPLPPLRTVDRIYMSDSAKVETPKEEASLTTPLMVPLAALSEEVPVRDEPHLRKQRMRREKTDKKTKKRERTKKSVEQALAAPAPEGEQSAEGVVEVSAGKRCCATLRRGGKRKEVPLGALLLVMFVSVLIQLAVTVPLLLLPAAQSAVAEQYATMRLTRDQYIILHNTSQVSFVREFIQTGNAKLYEQYEDYRGGGTAEEAIVQLRDHKISPAASDQLGNFLALVNQAQHYERIGITLTLLRFGIKPIRNYLSLEYPWDIMTETDRDDTLLQYPNLAYRYSNRSYDSHRSPDDMGRIARACVTTGPYRDIKAQVDVALTSSVGNATADQNADLAPLWVQVVMLAHIAIGLEPVFLLTVVVIAVLLRIEVITHFAPGELRRVKSAMMVVLVVGLLLGGLAEVVGVKMVLDITDDTLVPAVRTQEVIANSAEAYFAIIDAVNAVRDFAELGTPSLFDDYSAARDHALGAFGDLSVVEAAVESDEQGAVLDQIRQSFATLDRLLAISVVLARAGHQLDPSVSQALATLQWDITAEDSFMRDRLTYPERTIVYSNTSADMKLPPDAQLLIATSILYDRKFAASIAVVSSALASHREIILRALDSSTARLQADWTLLIYAFVGLDGVLVVLSFVGYWGSYVTITRHIKSKSTSIIQQHVEVPSAKRMSRKFTILSILATIIVVAFFIAVLQLLTYSSGAAWRAQQMSSRSQDVNSLLYLGSELVEFTRGFPTWSDALVAEGGDGLRLLQHINIMPTAVSFRRKLVYTAAQASNATDELLFGDATHSDYAIFGRLPEEMSYFFNSECVVKAQYALRDGGYLAPADCPSPVYTTAHRGTGGLHILFINFVDSALALYDSANDAGRAGSSLAPTIDWMRDAIGPLNDLIATSASFTQADAHKRLALAQTLDIIILVICAIMVIALFFACAQRWTKEIAVEESRTKGMLDMIPEDAFVIRQAASSG